MEPAISPLILLLKTPVPLPSLLFELREMVGLGEVRHTTPRAVTAEEPWAVTFPPPVAEVPEIPLMALVVTVGGELVVKDSSLPYAVPAELVAYALT